jgi:hydrogenase nickel incorporation protein HypA/HybF
LHELAIAQSIVDFLEKEAAERGLGRVEAVGLNIGELSDVVPEALEFGFQSITFGTDLESVKLRIKRIPLEAVCVDCGARFRVDDYFFVCPDCDSRRVEVVSGQEIDISYIEVAEDG